jgi:hypothetical protein
MIKALSPPIPLVYPWVRAPACLSFVHATVNLLEAAEHLEACCRATAGVLRIYISAVARPYDETLADLQVCASKECTAWRLHGGKLMI